MSNTCKYFIIVQIPVCGGILLNSAMTHCVLVRGSGTSWSFPRGKVNENEGRLECAIREVFEEVGYAMQCAEDDFLAKQLDDKSVTLYIAPNVPDQTAFVTHTIHV